MDMFIVLSVRKKNGKLEVDFWGTFDCPFEARKKFKSLPEEGEEFTTSIHLLSEIRAGYVDEYIREGTIVSELPAFKDDAPYIVQLAKVPYGWISLGWIYNI